MGGARKAILINLLAFSAVFLLIFVNVVKATSSVDFKVDYDSVTTGSENYKSADFQVQSGISAFESNSTSSDFTLATINLIPDTSAPVSVCGNGIIEAGESCDGANLGSATCVSQGFDSGNLTCNASCSFDTSACTNDSGSGGGNGGNTVPPNPTLVFFDKNTDENNKNNQDPIPVKDLDNPIPNNIHPAAISPQQPKAKANPNNPDKNIGKKSQKKEKKNTKKYDRTKLVFPLNQQLDKPIISFNKKEIIDRSPFITGVLHPNENYYLIVSDLLGRIYESVNIKTDINGRYVFESRDLLENGIYRIYINNTNGDIVDDRYFDIRNEKYNDLFIESFGELQEFENNFQKKIEIGEILRTPKMEIKGRGVPNSLIKAYFQSNEVLISETKVNLDGSFTLAIPKKLEDGQHTAYITQIHSNEKPSKNLTYKFSIVTKTNSCLAWVVLLIIFTLLLSRIFWLRKRIYGRYFFIIIFTILFAANFQAIPKGFKLSSTAYAAVPQMMLYEGRLLDSLGAPIATSHTFRISIWKNSDWVAGDELGSGAINVASPNYGGWHDEFTVTPNANGTFSIKLGSGVPLPNIDFASHKFLQIEVKTSAAPITSYQLLDPTGDNGADAVDRKTIGSVPYALNAEKAEKSNEEIFAIDYDDTIQNAGTGSVQLQFGNILNKILSYDTDNNYFNFNDDVNIEGDLTVTGTIEINSGGNSILLNATGLTSDRAVTFDDANTKVVGEDNTQTLTNKTIDGDNNTIQNISLSSLKDRNKTILLKPEYEKMTIAEDGTNNRATIKQNYDAANNHIFYYLTSKLATLQDLDLYLAIQVPEDFQSFQATPLQVFIKTTTTNATNNQIDFSMADTTNTAVALTGGTNVVSSVADTWEEKNITFGGAPTFTPGDFIILRVNMQAMLNNKAYISEIKFNYIGK